MTRHQFKINEEQKLYIKRLYLIHGNNIPYSFLDDKVGERYHLLFCIWWMHYIDPKYYYIPNYIKMETASLTDEGIEWLMN